MKIIIIIIYIIIIIILHYYYYYFLHYYYYFFTLLHILNIKHHLLQNKTIIVFTEMDPILFHLIEEESLSSSYGGYGKQTRIVCTMRHCPIPTLRLPSQVDPIDINPSN